MFIHTFLPVLWQREAIAVCIAVFQAILKNLFVLPCRLGSMAAKKLRRAKLSQELCERLSRYQITTCQVKRLFYGLGFIYLF